MRILIAGLLTVALLQLYGTPAPQINNSATQVKTKVHAVRAELPRKEVTDVKVEEKAQTNQPEVVEPEIVREAAVVETPKPQPTGGKYDLMAEAGIPATDYEYVDYIVSKESSWNPHAVNKDSGACSLVQVWPCEKLQGDWRDPVNALKWQYAYVNDRYGGYAGAYHFWMANNWY